MIGAGRWAARHALVGHLPGQDGQPRRQIRAGPSRKIGSRPMALNYLTPDGSLLTHARWLFINSRPTNSTVVPRSASQALLRCPFINVEKGLRVVFACSIPGCLE